MSGCLGYVSACAPACLDLAWISWNWSYLQLRSQTSVPRKTSPCTQLLGHLLVLTLEFSALLPQPPKYRSYRWMSPLVWAVLAPSPGSARFLPCCSSSDFSAFSCLSPLSPPLSFPLMAVKPADGELMPGDTQVGPLSAQSGFPSSRHRGSVQ